MGTITNFAGKYTDPNLLNLPPGAAREAVNVVSDRPGVAECRVGQVQLSGGYETTVERLLTAALYGTNSVEQTTTSLYLRDLSGGVSQVSAGEFPATPGGRMRFAVGGDDLYMATVEGVKVMDGPSSTPMLAGVPRALDVMEVASASGIPGAYPAGARATGTVTLAGGAGNVTITVNGTSVGPVSFTTSDTATASACVTALNANGSVAALVTASSSGAVITLTANNAGLGPNGITLSASRTAGTATVSGTTLTGGTAYGAAYRTTIVAYDAEGRPQESAPSGRVAYVNPLGSGVHGAQVRIPLHQDVALGMFVRVYRTTVVDSSVNPGDVMFLAAERPLTSGEIAQGWATVFDSQPDALLGAPLYTSATSAVGGITMANYRPPLAQEVALFRQSLFLANVTDPHRLSLRMIAPMDPGDTITIAGVAYSPTMDTVTEPPSVDGSGAVLFEATTALTPSENITAEVLSLIRVINRTDSGVYAYYTSGEGDPPGMFVIERRNITDAAFTVQSTVAGASFEPPISSAVSSTQDVRLNGISVSKSGLFYAFPSDSAYHLRLGRADKRILRLMANRDSLFAFKEDGVWVIYPAGAGWGYRQISTDVILQYPDSLAVLDNQIYAFTTRGIVAVDESGIEEVDAPIKNYVSAIRDATLNAAPSSVFAVADPVRLRYYLFYSDGSRGNLSTQALVYNAKTDTWTERDDSTTGGYIGADGLLYLGQGGSKYVRRDRNTGTTDDFKDPAGTAIHVTIEWASIISENPSGASRFTEMHLLTEEPTEGPYTFTFTSHYGESETCQPEGENLPEVRMWVPDGVQRTTRLKVRMERDVLEEPFAVLGITNSAKYYRGPATRG